MMLGAIAGMTAAVIMTPIDVVKTRLMTGGIAAARKEAADAGWSSLWSPARRDTTNIRGPASGGTTIMTTSPAVPIWHVCDRPH